MLDLAPLDIGFKGGVWNSELSPRSSWGAAPLKVGDKYRAIFYRFSSLFLGFALGFD